jgi:hypothetical protein
MTEFSIFLGKGKLTLDKLYTAFFAVEQKHERTVWINLTSLDFYDIRHDNNMHFSGVRHGVIGTLYGAQVVIDRDLKESYLISKNQNIYRLKMLQEEVLTYNVKFKFIANLT